MRRMHLFPLLGLLAAPVAAAEPAELERVRELILPAAEELAWRKIPWLTDLWDARKKAAEEARPIFLWEMDGHPLGCT